MAGNSRYKIPLDDGSFVEITVPVGASARHIRAEVARAVQERDADFSRSVSSAVAAEGRKAKAAAPTDRKSVRSALGTTPSKSALAGFEPSRQTAKEVTAPLEEVSPTSTESYWRRGLADQGEISSRPGTFHDLAANRATGIFSALGADEHNASRLGEKIAGGMDLTPWGSLDIGVEGAQDLASGRFLEAAGNLGMSALDLVPGAGHLAGMGLAGAGKLALPALAKGGSALSMFLGPMAKNANLEKLDLAKWMHANGATREQIWKDTGWFNQHGDWKFEISDLGLDVNKGRLPNQGKGTYAGNVISHPELEANYPEYRGGIFGNPLRVGGHISGPKIAGAYYPDQHVVTFSKGRTKPQMVSTAAHELQHGMPQVTENFPIGSRVGEHPPVWAGPEVDEIQRQKDSFTGLLDSLPEEVYDDPAVKRQLKTYDDALEAAAYRESYRRSAGEVEARNVQSRLGMEQGFRALGWSDETIAKQMRDTPPWLTQDRPDELQIVRRAEKIPEDAGPQLSIEDAGTPGKKPALTKAFEGVEDYPGALERAASGSHLRLDAEGNIMGSPGIAPGDLGGWRGRLDEKIAGANQEGLGWYEKGRGMIGEVSDTPEMASLFARGGAVYSPQASPIEETNYFLRHHNQRVLTGLDPVITTRDRAKAANLGYGDVGENSGFISLTPEDITLGKKTGPYGAAKDPTQPMGWTAASDLWHGRALGYPPDPGQNAFDRAFQPNEHAFLTGENVLATERARASGALPPDATVPNMQEVVWVEQRKQSFLEKENAKYAAGKRATPPTEEEALVYARQGVGSGIERNTAILSREFTPGGGLGEFPGMSADPELNARFASDMAAAGDNPKNSVLSSLQLYQRPTVSGEGFWNDPVEGLQRNPAFMDRPLVGLQPEMIGGKKAGPGMDPHSKQALLTAGQLFGVENVQHGVGANIFIPQTSTHKAGQLNGLYFGPEGRQEAMDKAVAAGLDVVDNGDGGIVVTSFNDDTAGAAKKVREFAKEAGGKLGRFDSNYAPSNLPEEQGTGEATKSLLEATGAIPGFEQRLASSTYPAEVAARNDVRERYASELATSLRPDVQKLRDLLARGGPAAVRSWIEKNGMRGLPAWTAALLGGGAMLSAQDQAQPAPL